MNRQFSFALAGQISAAAQLEPTHFSDARILTHSHLTGLVSDIRGEGTSTGAAVAVLRHVLLRTFRFGKAVEHVTMREIIHGFQHLSIDSAGYSESTIRRAIHVLIERGYLIRIETDYGRLHFYALDMALIINKINDLWKGKKPAGAEASENYARLQRLLLICNRLHIFYDALKDLSTKNLYTFVQEMKQKMGGVMSELKSMVAGAVERVQTINKKKTDAKADAKAMRGEAGLAYWKQAVKDQQQAHPGRYKGYKERGTGKLKGQFTNWVKEMEADGMSTKEIKDRVLDLVENWHLLANTSFWCTTEGYKGTRTVPPVPQFEFLYTYRNDFEPRLLELIMTPEEQAAVDELPDLDFGDGPGALDYSQI